MTVQLPTAGAKYDQNLANQTNARVNTRLTNTEGVTGALQTLTNNGIIIGQSGNAMTPKNPTTLSVGATGQILVGNTNAAPSWLTAGTNGQLLIGQTGAASAFTTMSGDGTITNAGLLSVTKINGSQGSSGQVLIAQSSAAPAFETMGGDAVINAAGSLTINKTTQAQAETGTDNANFMTALRTAEAITGQVISLKNIVGRNGGMEVSQRTAQGVGAAVAASTAQYTVDGWYLLTGTNQACTVTQTTGIVTGSNNCVKVARNNGQTGTGTLYFAMPLDTDELVRIQGKILALSFWTATGANWSPTSGTLTYNLYVGTGGVGKRNSFPYAGETNPITGSVNLAAGASAARTVAAVSSSVATNITCAELQFSWAPTGTAGANDWFELDDVQLEICPSGVVPATPVYDRLPFNLELTLCRAHYNKTFDYGVTVAQSSASTNGVIALQAPTTSHQISWPYGVNMRAVPSITTYSPSAATSAWAGTGTPAASTGNIGRSAATIIAASGSTDGAAYTIHASADASI